MIADVQEALQSLERAESYHSNARAAGGGEYHHLSASDDDRIEALISQAQDRLEEIHSLLSGD